jgi:hypothetical protein
LAGFGTILDTIIVAFKRLQMPQIGLFIFPDGSPLRSEGIQIGRLKSRAQTIASVPAQPEQFGDFIRAIQRKESTQVSSMETFGKVVDVSCRAKNT